MRISFLLTICVLIPLSGMMGQAELLKDINPGSEGSVPEHFLVVGSQILFSAETEDVGRELWITDGTESGTRLIKDINPDDQFRGGHSNPENFIFYDGLVYFTATAPETGRELWVTNGTAAGTQLLVDIDEGEGDGNPHDFVIFRDLLFMTATRADEGAELWVSNGTDEGTELFVDVAPGQFSSSPAEKTVTPDGEYLVFAAATEEEGVELWSIDASITTGGLQSFPINPDTASSSPAGFSAVGSDLYFAATVDTLGRELFRTDGTPSGTEFAADFNEGEESSNPREIIAVDGSPFIDPALFCLAQPDSTGNAEIMVFQPGPNQFNTYLADSLSAPSNLQSIDNVLFLFDAELVREDMQGEVDSMGRELFMADPLSLVFDNPVRTMSFTADKDAQFGSVVVDPFDLWLYYPKETEQSGRELYRVPVFGNYEDEAQVTDINPDAGDSQISHLVIRGKDLYFQATDGNTGLEPYAFRGERGAYALAILPNLQPVETNDTLDLGVVKEDFDTTLVFEIAAQEAPVIFINNVSVDGEGYSMDPFTPVALAVGGNQEKDTFEVQYTASGEGNIDIGTVTVAGEFAVEDSIVFYIKSEVEESTSTQNPIARNWNISPNPVSNQAILSGDPLEQDVDVEIISSSGEIVRSLNLQQYQNQRKLILRDLQPGSYFIRMQDGEGSSLTLRFIKL